MKFVRATRSKTWLKVGLAAPSGCGKTYSALLLARGLIGDWNKVGVICTENGSAHLYSHLGPYQVLTLDHPFSPERYIEAMVAARDAGFEALVIDSMSHEWSGAGGALDLQSQLGGRFQDWAKVTPRHQRFVTCIVRYPGHVICCTRTKTDWALADGRNGKPQPTKVGTKLEQRDGLEFELTVAWRLNESHLAIPEKDRTGLFLTTDGPVEERISIATGERLAAWALSGAPQAPQDPERQESPQEGPQTPARDRPRVALYEGTPEHVAAIERGLDKYQVPTEIRHIVHQRMLGQPSTAFGSILREVLQHGPH